MKEGLEERAKLVARREKEKAKKPKFRRQESWRYKRIKENWRKPRGLDNKMRKKVKGWPSSPRSGYGGPRVSRNLHPSGFEEVRVFNLDDLANVDSRLQAIRIAHTVGTRKRIEIVNRAKQMGIHVLNPREFKELEEPTTEKGSSTKA